MKKRKCKLRNTVNLALENCKHLAGKGKQAMLIIMFSTPLNGPNSLKYFPSGVASCRNLKTSDPRTGSGRGAFGFKKLVYFCNAVESPP